MRSDAQHTAVEVTLQHGPLRSAPHDIPAEMQPGSLFIRVHDIFFFFPHLFILRII